MAISLTDLPLAISLRTSISEGVRGVVEGWLGCGRRSWLDIWWQRKRWCRVAHCRAVSISSCELSLRIMLMSPCAARSVMASRVSSGEKMSHCERGKRCWRLMRAGMEGMSKLV